MAYKLIIQYTYFKIKQLTKVKGEDSIISDRIKAISFINIEELGKIFYLRNKNYEKLTGHKEVKQSDVESDKAVWYDEYSDKLYTIKELYELVCKTGMQVKQNKSKGR